MKQKPAITFSIQLDHAFETGDENDQFQDIPNMNDQALNALASFMQKVVAGEPLPGKNKPSWLNDDLDTIPYTKLYEQYSYWHYHCGPDYPQSNFSMTHNLSLNLNGATSPAVIHYIKNSHTEITITGYSPVHIPFPVSDLNTNPLFKE
ncbi:hypothetical protein [Shewanella sp. SM96]|uniref:hypothetical protein n=1 Tax=Shewanella sp. SM96 TaxID=2912813 RepID=UPI0021DAD67C|nr:hypothetical protein [Shewanella sp. SM96]MCU8005505.1 hypothetical protein [Shewanella sp. SM96]